MGGQRLTREQSTQLKRVNLRVSMKNFKHFKMFGTELKKGPDGVYQDPCAGDSGGPLMYQDKGSGRWMLIGQSMELAWIAERVTWPILKAQQMGSGIRFLITQTGLSPRSSRLKHLKQKGVRKNPGPRYLSIPGLLSSPNGC